MRYTKEELRAISKKWPYPNYIIIPAAGSLFGDIEALRGKTASEVTGTLERMIEQSGARRLKP